ncbi:alpha/beta hydrolase family protein [Phyllobacterium meliloti]|uniref:alpha/beta hydrolase family protein n=1 Tax=Phyllobacterium meliloti TaxID=555317 RepID=UPI001D1581E8|nr:dienelactone hydrolase family protein [Phyllobacterium sp. T1293]UGX88885.1 dienelactone hydrolase family protein [Phyllobacterium sp. T1293]
MKFLSLMLGLFWSVTATATVLADGHIGVTQMTIASLERGRNLSVTIWYPATEGGQEILLAESKLFEGTRAFRDAPIAGGRYPLIVVSHGSGGRIEDLGWIASHLAEAGFIVAGPNHPGTTSRDSTPADTPKLWERTNDLSEVVSALTAAGQWSGSIVKERVGVLGFSLGGAAAMELSGARANLEAYARYCDTYKTMSDCIWYAGGKGYVNGEAVSTEVVDLRKIDKVRFEQSNLDPRIKSAVLIDPALAQAYDVESLKKIGIPTHFINLGRVGGVPVAVAAQKLSELTPNSELINVNDAVHFSFLANCRSGGPQLLKSIGETDALCDDGGGRSRTDIHAELGEIIAEAFARTLKDVR